MQLKITLLPDQKLWFTSDTHYNHSNICSGTSRWDTLDNTRDFDNFELMNNHIVNNINELVNENDILIHLGDWSFGGMNSIGEFRNRINCKNIHMVLGNHDHLIEQNEELQSMFVSVQDYLHVSIGKTNIICMHYPISSWNGQNKGYLHLHGHMHSKTPNTGKNSMDIGLDPNNLKPVELNCIIDYLKNTK